ncbi:hypothetical protein [Rhodoferax sp. U11-2br]|uniref:hypothetical protein n=1 Tax=Rhodoferax sp. U11-2br TaxID=2838878 RepID=UPI001BE97051|nr:hypothetical protein [Rhodoferax sp. U11-2br]MBT3066067.1 hypothetical protein [Rhodoferax sp. U11-2br]
MKNVIPTPTTRGWFKPLVTLMVLGMAAALTTVHAQPPGPAPVKKKLVTAKSKSRVELKTQATQMASGMRAADAALSPQELAIAERVEVGRMPCELGVVVNVASEAAAPGYFDVWGKNFKFKMAPVVSSTGAIRLEDPVAGAVWLQLSNKSMLMNHKTGSRLADACMTPMQVAVADAMTKNPQPNLLEPLPVVTEQTAPTPAATVAPVSTVH